jgi:outer membrane protein, heavy metal efflux system
MLFWGAFNLLSRKTCLAIGLFWAIFPTMVLAQGVPRNLRIEEAIQRAESNNPQLLVARRNVAAAEAGAVIAIATPNPRIALDAPIGLAETKRTVSIEQPFELGGKREARLNLASDQIQSAQLQLEILRWQIRSDVRQAYAELAIAKSARRQGEQTVVLAQQLVEIARKRLAAGDVAEADLIQVRFVLERARQRLEPTANRIRQATIRLDNLLGEPPDDSIQPTDQKVFSLSVEEDRIVPEAPPPIPDLTVLRTLAQKRRIDLSLAVLQQRIGDDQLKLARSNQIPDISFATGFTWDPVAATTAALLGLRIDLPIFNPRQGEVNQALANRSLAEAQRLVLERQVEREVTAAYEDVRSAERLLKQDRNVLLPQSEQVLELARKSYQFGQTGLSDVLIAQQSVQDQRDAYYNDVLAYQTALGSLERAVNQPLTSNPDVPTTP